MILRIIHLMSSSAHQEPMYFIANHPINEPQSWEPTAEKPERDITLAVPDEINVRQDPSVLPAR